jgi:hypothetical protein
MRDHDTEPADPQGSVPDAAHQRPEHASDGTVEAAGKVSEAFEWIERARGRLFDLHQMIGHADFLLGDAADLLDEHDESELADLVRREAIGRNVLDGRWTFQIIEEFDQTYFSVVRQVEERVREELMDGRTHVYEAELKEQRRTQGRRGHESRPSMGGEDPG